jgi:basic membrane protein A and related proteins
VDTDQYITFFLREGIPYNHLVLTSAMKNLDVAVFSTIEDFVMGRFTPGIKMYDLSNNGVGIAPFHELSESVPATVEQLVKTTQVMILNGEVDINNSCR